MTVQHQYEYKVLEDHVEYEEATKSFKVKHAFTEDPSILSNNINQVVKIAEREERKLHKEGLTTSFNQEFDKLLMNNVLQELTEDEMAAWAGPVHYISLQHVYKPTSATTPLRIVANSSLSDRNGVSLNSILVKGPNVLSDQPEVIARWRNYETAFRADLTKAYYSLRSG